MENKHWKFHRREWVAAAVVWFLLLWVKLHVEERIDTMKMDPHGMLDFDSCLSRGATLHQWTITHNELDGQRLDHTH